jgi:hypothetical protein
VSHDKVGRLLKHGEAYYNARIIISMSNPLPNQSLKFIGPHANSLANMIFIDDGASVVDFGYTPILDRRFGYVAEV